MSKIQKAKIKGRSYSPEIFKNGDTAKQLLARSRYLLYKAPSNWTVSQSKRAKILFQEYPDITKAYKLVNNLRSIFNDTISIEAGYTRLAHWYKEVEKSGF